MRSLRPSLGSSLLWLLLGIPAWLPGTIVIEGGAPQIDNIRFANDPSFIAANLLSGVGRSGFYQEGRWGTLISPRMIIAAQHWHPEAGQPIEFFATNDPAGPFETRTVLAGQRIGVSDLWVGLLDESLPAPYAPFAVISTPITSSSAFNNSSIFEQEAYVLGRSDNVPFSVINHAVGRNKIDYWYQQVTDGITTDYAVAAIQDLPDDADFVADEAYLQLYDSGAPLLMELNGVLTLIGINWFIKEDVDVDPRPFVKLRNLSGFSYAGNYYAAIQSIIEAYPADVTAGYLAWRTVHFGSDLSVGGPAADSDGDGLLNFIEYAFATNPLSGSDPSPVSSTIYEADGMAYLQARFSVQADPDLLYFINSGSDLMGWTRVDLLFDGSVWSSTDPAVLLVSAALDNGDGTWLLTVQSTDPLVPAAPRFLAPGVE